MEFDLGLAVREDSENPIYYVEYAHARICSLLRALAEEGTSVPRQADVDMSLLSGEAERALRSRSPSSARRSSWRPGITHPSHINRYLQELAACFHPVLHRPAASRARVGGPGRPAEAGG